MQISAGCHHNALITKDGSLYTWGRNLDGQIGNGTRREVPIPMPLYYNSACILAQIPPRHNDFKRNQWDLDTGAKSNDSLANNGNMPENNGNIRDSSVHTETAGLNKERINPVINAIGVACGYDYTVAIQPGYKETYIYIYIHTYIYVYTPVFIYTLLKIYILIINIYFIYI